MYRTLSLLVSLVCLTLSAGSANASRQSREHAPTAAARSSSDPVLVGAGDIASCDDLAGAKATAALIDSIAGTVFAAGDLAYPDGSDKNFARCYEPTWGRFKSRTRPVPGNHEYHKSGASGYARYFGAAAGDPTKGYYSYDLGAWHVVALNSECAEVGGCDPASPQGQWLTRDLAQHASFCTVAYLHKPLFSSAEHHGSNPELKPVWQILYSAGADVVIGGHDHDYERFAPQDPDGHADPARGIRQFVAGTGGKNSHPVFGTPKPNSEVRNSGTFGVLKLTLRPSSYDWEFIPETGEAFTDSGSASCH